MRVGVLIKRTTFGKGFGGLEVQNKILCEGLAARGHEVLVFSPLSNFDAAHQGTGGSDANYSTPQARQNQLKEQGYVLLDASGVRYIFIPAVFRMGSPFDLVEKVLSKILRPFLGKEVSKIFSTKGKADWKGKSFACIKNFHEEKPFDVIISQSSAGIGVIRKKKELGAAIVSISHGTVLGEYKSKFKSDSSLKYFLNVTNFLSLLRDIVYVVANFFSIQREFIHGADINVAVSDFVKQSLIDETFVLEDKVQVIYNGVAVPPLDKGEFASAKENSEETNQIKIMYAGRVEKSKGLRVLVDAFEKLLAMMHNTGDNGQADLEITLSVCGDGSYLSELTEYVSKKGLSEHVSLHGNLDSIALQKERISSDIVVIPSIRLEGFPMVLAESMICGLPIIGSASGGIKDGIQDGETGFLVTPGSVDELAEKIKILAVDSDLRASMGEKAREVALQKYTLDIMLNSYEEVLRKAQET